MAVAPRKRPYRTRLTGRLALSFSCGLTRRALDVVALLSALPEQSLSRGQVGTIVELVNDETALVEFSDDQGRAYAIVPCPRAELLALQYSSEAA